MGILGILGGLMALVGWIWLIVVAFKEAGAVWGVVNIFLQPVTGLIFCIVKKTGWMQFLMMIVGLVLCFGTGGLAFMSNYPGMN